MKRLLTLLFLVLFVFTIPVAVYAQEWHSTNQATVIWDAVAPLEDTDTISYNVYLKDMDGNIEFYENTADTTSIITFSEEGRYFVGVSTKRVVASGDEAESEVNWSDVNGTSTPTPFGVVYVIMPNMPQGLQLQ